MKKIILASVFCSLAVQAAFAQATKGKAQAGGNNTGWQKLPNGLEYKIWKDVPGASPKEGDFVAIHTKAKVGDSVLFSSRAMNNNEPFEIPLGPPQQPKYDLMEGFKVLSAGDSATFRLPLDTALVLGVPEAPWMKKGAGLWFDQEVVMVSQKTAAQKEKEDADKVQGLVKIEDDKLQEHFKRNKITPTKHASGMYILVNSKGTGPKAEVNKKVTVNYTGRNLDGKTFDSNVDPSFNHVQPFQFDLGQGRVIKGWDIGVAELKVGDKATLYIPSYLAYGERSPSPDIPKNGILVFDVEVTGVE